jgi:hypothetical protein
MTPRRALPNRRSVLASIAAAGTFAAIGARAQSNWPDHPVRIIVPYPAGGSTDVLSHPGGADEGDVRPALRDRKPARRRRQVIGIAAVTGSRLTATTIGAATIGHFAINQYLSAKMPYDAGRDTIPASLTGSCPRTFSSSRPTTAGEIGVRVHLLGKAKGRQLWQSRRPERRRICPA